MDLLEISGTWIFWDREIPASVRRDVALPESLSDTLVLVVQGVRRCGKSTLLQQLVERYGLDRQRCAFLNLEDPRLAGALTWESLDAWVTAFRGRHPDAERLWFFIDEIQWATGWQRWLRTQLDRPRGHVFVVSGSNAELLRADTSTVLTGRHLTLELYPFDHGELVRAHPGATLTDYLTHGGFPEPWRMRDGDRLRRQYFDDIVERDVRERVGARSSRPIRQVVQMLYEASGTQTSVRRLAAAVGIAPDTAGAYVDAAESAYLLFGCPWFAFSERQRASHNRKFYPVDTGLRRVVVTRTGADLGRALECAVYLALRRRFREVYYWDGAGEVDFVVYDGGRIVPIQVTWDVPQERHQRGLDAFYERFGQADEALFVTADTFPHGLDRLCTR